MMMMMMMMMMIVVDYTDDDDSKDYYYYALFQLISRTEIAESLILDKVTCPIGKSRLMITIIDIIS